jgi:ribonucleoside-triphosphate reductase (thioredoxin)
MAANVLAEDFVDGFPANPPMGFNGLGALVFARTYARPQPKCSGLETWRDCVVRVVEGTYRVRRRYLTQQPDRRRHQAKDVFRRMYDMKFLPAGRGLWAMGTDIVDKKQLGAALNSCAFVSTGGDDRVAPFLTLMDMAMLGVGVGFDTKAADTGRVVRSPTVAGVHVVEDTREGWVASAAAVLRPYLGADGDDGTVPADFDYSRIRPAGQVLNTFGGTSAGAEPLRELHRMLVTRLDAARGLPVSCTLVVDIMNLIGRCVVSGNVRRTAEIAIGRADDAEFLALKDYTRNPERAAWGWVSNNSVYATPGTDYKDIAARIYDNGEPGICWLENMQAYSRMCDAPDHRDWRVCGGNPCMEQSLEDMEMCNLVETFPHRHESKEDFAQTLRCALLYAKTVTLVPSGVHRGAVTDSIVARNRRIGCSVSGIAQFLATRSLEELREWLLYGYEVLREEDAWLSAEMGVPHSIKLTSVKPSGSVSLLAGATPGMHFPISRFYIRRVRLSKRNVDLVRALAAAGYPLEDCVVSPDDTVIVSIPVDVGTDIRSARSVSIWEQVALAAFLQRFWADNQVSVTVTFDRAQVSQHDICRVLGFFQHHLKSVAFLPLLSDAAGGCYPQMPYEEIDEATYNCLTAALNSRFAHAPVEHVEEAFCDNDQCSLR